MRRVIAYSIMILGQVLYDQVFKHSTNETFENVSYFAPLFLSFSLLAFLDASESRRYNVLFLGFFVVFAIRFLLNLACVTCTKQVYDQVINSDYVDYVTWFILAAFLIKFLWLNR